MSTNDMARNAMSELLKRTQGPSTAKLSDEPELEKCMKDSVTQQAIVSRILDLFHSPRGKLETELLFAACVVSDDIQLVGSVIARFLFTARGNEQLKFVVAFATTLAAYYPSAMTCGVRKLFIHLDEFTKQRQSHLSYTPLDMDEFPDCRFISNLLNLFSWHMSDREHRTRHAGLCLADLRGELHVALMDWILSFTSKLVDVNKGGTSEAALTVVSDFLSLMQLVAPTSPIHIHQAVQLVKLSAAWLVLLAQLVTEERLEVVELFRRFLNIARQLVASQPSVDGRDLFIAIVSEALENHVKLFRQKVPGAELTPNERTSVVGKEWTSERSLLEELRSTPFHAGNTRSATSIAHTGELRRKKPRPQRGSAGEGVDTTTQHLRVLLLTEVVEESLAAAADVDTAGTVASLGQLLCEWACVDGLTSSSTWESWELEKELVSRYIEIVKRMDEVQFVQNLLGLLGGDLLRYALPIVKARFATTLAYFENTPTKEGRVNTAGTAKLDEIFPLFAEDALFRQVNLLPQTLDVCRELVQHATNHEVSTILQAIWRVVQYVVERRDEAGAPEERLVLASDPGMDLVNKTVLVIQRNITELSHLLPRLQRIMGDVTTKADDEWT